MSPTKRLIGTTLREKILHDPLGSVKLISVVAVGFVSDPRRSHGRSFPLFGESVTDTIADTNVPNTANETNKSEVYFEIANLTPQARGHYRGS